jgi:peptide/nickel transport system substrate-binding protein
MSRRSPVISIVAISVAGMMAMSGCATGVVAQPDADAQRVDGGTILYGHQQEPACVYGGWIEQAYLSYQVLDNLVSLDEDHEIVPWLAETWEVADDQLSWTFTLKEGVSFTDGSPLDAAAVAYNFDYWGTGGNGTAAVWLGGYYESAEVLDDLTLRVNLAKPYPLFAQNLTQAYFGIQSQVALETRTEEENCAAPIGTGAFTVGDWNRGENILLHRNEDYTSPPANARHDGPAYVETVDWKFIGDATTRVSALRAGETDAIYDVPAIEWAGLDESEYELHTYVTPGRPQQITFNTAKGVFVDEELRKAFVYSLDRETIVETIGKGVIPYEGNGAVSQATPGYSTDAAEAYEFDLERANQLLDDAGWSERDEEGYRLKDGDVLEVRFPYAAGRTINADGAAILQGVQQQAKAAGFKVDLIPIPASAAASGQYSGVDGYDISVGYWTSVNAGIQYINWRQDLPESPNLWNQAFYNDPALEELIVRANSAVDLDEQNALYAESQEYIADRALAVGIYARLSTLAVNPSLKDVWQEHSQGGPVFHDAYLVE